MMKRIMIAMLPAFLMACSTSVQSISTEITDSEKNPEPVQETEVYVNDLRQLDDCTADMISSDSVWFNRDCKVISYDEVMELIENAVDEDGKPYILKSPLKMSPDYKTEGEIELYFGDPFYISETGEAENSVLIPVSYQRFRCDVSGDVISIWFIPFCYRDMDGYHLKTYELNSETYADGLIEIRHEQTVKS